MDEEVIRNDSTYISTSLAAELSGYSRDYVGQLARDGHFDSTKIGRKRFVERSEFIRYALENKKQLTVSDLPDNHVPDELADNQPSATDDDPSRGQPDAADDHGSHDSDTAPVKQLGEKSAVIANPQGVEPNSFETQPDDVAVERVSSRWRKRRNRGRSTNKRRKKLSAPDATTGRLTAAAASIALMAVSVFGFAFASSSSAQTKAGQVAGNVVAAAERAYEGVGFGLQQKLAERPAPAVIAGSVSDTAELIADAGTDFQKRLGNHLGQRLQTSRSDSSQMAAAALADIVSGSFAFVGNEITNRFSWITNAGSTSAFRQDGNDFTNRATRLTQAGIRYEQIGSPTEDTSAHQQNETENATSSPQERLSTTTINAANESRKAVVVPAPTSTQARKQAKQEIREQFSDPVTISTSSNNSGVIQPQFEDRQGREYLYIMVPTDTERKAQD